MGYQQAEDLMGDVRRWDANEWDARDVSAPVYWGVRDGPHNDLHRAATVAISVRAAGGDAQAKQVEALLKRLDSDVELSVRRALERHAGEALDDDYVSAQYPNAKLAVLHAVTGEAARPWLPAGDADALTAGFRAADEKLDSQFTLGTRDQQEWDAAKGFMDEVRKTYPGTMPTFDPPHKRPVGRWSVIATAYKPGDDAQDQLSRELETLLRLHDPVSRIGWPPPDFRTRRRRH